MGGELGGGWILKNRRFPNKSGLVIHVLHHWQLLEEIYTRDNQKISNDILSVIIILGIDVHGGEIVILNWMTMNYIGEMAPVLKHSHGRCVVDAFDKNLHEGSIWNGPRAVLSFILHNQYFLTLYIMVQNFMTNI